MEQIKMATQKQLDYLLLGAKEEEIKNLNIKEAGFMIYKLKGGSKKKTTKKEQVKVNHSFKVGDVLEVSWGYDQTNEDFFIITELVGANSVRIKECVMGVKECNNYSHGMARDISYDPTTAKPKNKSMWIKDQEGKGDLHRVIHLNYNNEDREYITLENRYHAHKYYGQSVYESWYA